MVEPASSACCQSSLMPMERVFSGAAAKYFALIWSKSWRMAWKSARRFAGWLRSTMVMRPISLRFW